MKRFGSVERRRPAPRTVSFPSGSQTLAGLLYLPPQGATNRHRAAIVVGHPWSGVKEQTAGTYASALARAGFTALAFDAAFQGESTGEPRHLEDPSHRAEDIKSAVTFLSTLERLVDSERIGALGICASGGYVCFSAQTDVRIKAVATVSAIDAGSLVRDGLKGTAAASEPVALTKTLKLAGELRVDEAKGAKPALGPLTPDDPEEMGSDVPNLYAEACQYYRGPRGHHPRSVNAFVMRSAELLANYDSFAFNRLITPRPLLLVAGSAADTLYHSLAAYDRAEEPKELVQIPGQTHVGLYDDLEESLPHLVGFFKSSLVE